MKHLNKLFTALSGSTITLELYIILTILFIVYVVIIQFQIKLTYFR